MKSLNLDQIQELSEILDSVQGNFYQQDDASGAKYERAYNRMQGTLDQFKKDPTNPAKVKAFQNALSAYEVACRVFMIKAQSALTQAQRRNIKLGNRAVSGDIARMLSEKFSAKNMH